MSLFCRHKWAQADKTILPSARQQMGASLAPGGPIPPWVYEVAVVYLIRCEKCGAVKTIKESNP